MTARHQIRVGGRRLGRDRAPIDATPAPSLGEQLQDAREKKGVDLYRAERDTKIRVKHLASLENGDYSELPGAVYTKGFLRNYALYLGLDPDDVIAKWRDEQDYVRRAEPVAVTAPPQPLAEPKGRLTFTRGVLVAAFLTIVIAAFLAYLGMQVLRFTQSVPIAVSGSLIRQLPTDATSASLSGTTSSAATIVITQPGTDFTKSTEAQADGAWSLEVPVSKGRNDFTLIARDAVTKHESDPVNLVINVAVPATPTPAATPSPVISGGVLVSPAALTVTSPTDGASFDGTVSIAGTTNGTHVSRSVHAAESLPSPSASALPAPTGSGPTVVPDVELPVGTDGSFSEALSLPAGIWTITLAASGDGLADTETTRTVQVSISGIVVVVEARGGAAWIEVWVDGNHVDVGHTLKNGESRSYTGKKTLVVHTGNATATYVTFNGKVTGPLDPVVTVGTWSFEKGKPPRRL